MRKVMFWNDYNHLDKKDKAIKNKQKKYIFVLKVSPF